MATQSPRTPLIRGWNPPTVKPPAQPSLRSGAASRKVSIREETRNKGTGKPKTAAMKKR